MRYELQFSREAAEDLNEVYEYISQVFSAPKAAAELMRKLDVTINLLREQPAMGVRCREQPFGEMGYRKLVIDRYVVIYSVKETKRTVMVLRIFYGKRDYDKFIR